MSLPWKYCSRNKNENSHFPSRPGRLNEAAFLLRPSPRDRQGAISCDSSRSGWVEKRNSPPSWLSHLWSRWKTLVSRRDPNPRNRPGRLGE